MKDMNVSGEGTVRVVALEGRLDMVTAPRLREVLANLAGSGTPKLVVNLAAVSFIDSSGLGALIAGLKAARQAGGDLRLAAPGDQAVSVLRLTTLDRVLVCHATVEEAVAAL